MVATLPTNIASAHSAANGATSVAPVLTASTAGSLLVLFVTVVGTGTPTVSGVTDSGSNTWVQALHVPNSTTLLTDIWVAFNAASATTVTATLAGTVQGVSATAIEFTGIGPAAFLEFTNASTGTATTAVPQQVTTQPVASEELNLLVVGYTAPTTFLSTSTRSAEWNWNTSTGSLADVVSTGGTNNSEHRVYAASNGPNNVSFSGTLGASSSFAVAYVRYLLTPTTNNLFPLVGKASDNHFATMGSPGGLFVNGGARGVMIGG